MGGQGRKTERGAAAVEFALILPLLMVILFGTIDWGWYFFVQQIVNNAAREGARVGSLTVPGTPGADATAKEQAEAQARTYLSAAGLRGTASVDAVVTGTFVQVTVSYPTGSLTGFDWKGLTSLYPKNAWAQSQMANF